MMAGHSLLCLVLLLTSFAYRGGQGNTVKPIRHSLPDGLQQMSGSSSDGGCTSRNGSICNLQDGGTSVLFDNTITLRSGLEGDQWARDLFTVMRLQRGDVVIGFDFGTHVQLKRVELVMFLCASTRVHQVLIYGNTSSDRFPASDPKNSTQSGSRLVSTANHDNSCENLYRLCVPTRGTTGQFKVYYIVIPNGAKSDWVYLAETIFHTDHGMCGPDTLVTEPVPPPEATTDPMMTSNIGTPTAPSTTEEKDPASTMSNSTTTPRSQSGLTTTSSTRKEANPASGVNSVTISVIVVIIVLCVVAVVSAVVIIFLARRRQKKKSIDMNGGMCPSLNCFGTSRDISQSGQQNEPYDATVLTPATGQVELPPSGYESEDKILPNLPEEKHSTTVVREDTSTPQELLEGMYPVIPEPKNTMKKPTTKGASPPIPPPYTAADTKKPKEAKKEGNFEVPPPGPPDNMGEIYAVVQKPKNKPITEDEDAPPIPPHTAADTYAVVNKILKPKGEKKEGKVPPSSPSDNVGEMYAVVKKPEDESEPPAIPPHTVDALYSC